MVFAVFNRKHLLCIYLHNTRPFVCNNSIYIQLDVGLKYEQNSETLGTCIGVNSISAVSGDVTIP